MDRKRSNKKKHNRKKSKKTNPLFIALFYLFPIIGLIVPYIIYRANFAPVLTETLMDELSFVKYLVLNRSHTFANGWISTKPYVPLSTRFFLTYYYTDFANWKTALLNSVTAVYAIFCAAYLFFVSGLHAKKFYTYTIAAIPGVLLALFGLKLTYECNYFLTIITPLFIVLGFLLHGIRSEKLPIPARIGISALCIVPVIAVFVYMGHMKASYAFDNSDLISFKTEENPTDITSKYSGLVNFLKLQDLPVSYCTDSIINEVTVIGDSQVTLAPISSVEELTRFDEPSDSFANPYESVSLDTKPFYMIYDNETLKEYSSSLYIKFGKEIFNDGNYSVYSYDNIAYFNDSVFQNNIIDLANSKYDSFYYSFQGADINDPKDFPVFSGTNPIFIHPSTTDFENVNVLLDSAVSKEGIKNVFFELDTVSLASLEGSSELEYIDKMISKYSDVTFFITLGYPGVSYWRQYNDSERKALISSYETVVKKLSHNDNILFFAPGGEKWLVESKGNYIDGAPKEEVALSLLVTVVCNRGYQVDKNTVTDYEKKMSDLVAEKIQYPDLSDMEVVFFGDSILGNYHGSLSIPGLCEGLSDCKSYNLGIGGTSAIGDFNNIVDYFLGQSYDYGRDSKEFEEELARYRAESDASKKKLFVINYGVNDYFSGIPAREGDGTPYEDYDYDSYESAMKDGIAGLKEAYPDCSICIIAPIYTDYFDSGKEVKSSVGSPLETYREAGRSVSESTNALWLNSTELILIDAKNCKTYLVDGVHPTNEGLYLISSAIVKFLGENR